MRDCTIELEGLRDSASNGELLLRKDIDELRAEVDDLAELVKVKDRMLDDQNMSMSHMKAALKQKDDELMNQSEKQGKYHAKYEDRIAAA